jgi:hypothetical protein
MPGETDLMQELHKEAADLLQQKKTDEYIVGHLITKGHERHYAETVLENVKEDVADKIGFRNTFLYGLGFIIAGVLLTYTSRHFAINSGAFFYFFFGGLMVAGISFIARAFIIFRK